MLNSILNNLWTYSLTCSIFFLIVLVIAFLNQWRRSAATEPCNDMNENTIERRNWTNLQLHSEISNQRYAIDHFHLIILVELKVIFDLSSINGRLTVNPISEISPVIWVWICPATGIRTSLKRDESTSHSAVICNIIDYQQFQHSDESPERSRTVCSCTISSRRTIGFWNIQFKFFAH